MATKLRKIGQLQSIREGFFWRIIRTIRTNPDHMFIHAGTHDLPSKKGSAEISREIVELALKLKSDTFHVSVLYLTTQNDKYRKKTLKVKQH